MSDVPRRQRRLADHLQTLSVAVVHRRRRHVGNASVAVFRIIPRKEAVEGYAGLLLVVKALGEQRAVLQRLERCLAVRGVVGGVRPAVAAE